MAADKDASYNRIGLHYYFASDHLRAASLMADHCRRREDECLENAKRGIDFETRSYALAAIMSSVAYLEAVVNEIWYAATDSKDGRSPYLAGLEPRAIGLLRELGKRSKVERTLGIVERYSLPLICAGLPPVDLSCRPGQDVRALIDVRNALVHFKPEHQWTDSVHTLEAKLKHLVPANPLMTRSGPWFPHHVLCAGVARWACDRAVEFAETWRHSLGLSYDSSQQFPTYWSED